MAYKNSMFEWDEAKSEANLESRGFDFAYAARIFEGPTLELDDDRAEYGERLWGPILSLCVEKRL